MDTISITNLDKTNNIGTGVENTDIHNVISQAVSDWTEFIGSKTTIWRKANFIAIANFLLTNCGNLIQIANSITAPGTDKKATVLAAMTKIYDLIIVNAIPIWLKPFSPFIRSIVINELLPALIDYLVGKLKSQPVSA